MMLGGSEQNERSKFYARDGYEARALLTPGDRYTQVEHMGDSKHIVLVKPCIENDHRSRPFHRAQGSQRYRGCRI